MRYFQFMAAIGVALAAASPLCRAAETIAVLPLFNVDANKSPNLDWIGESVSETIQEALSSSGLLVLPRENREEVYHRLSLRTGVVLTKASVLKIGEARDDDVRALAVGGNGGGCDGDVGHLLCRLHYAAAARECQRGAGDE